MGNVVSERISKKIYDIWFLSEPALYGILCSHELTENPKIPIAVRCGKGRIEYNPTIAKDLTDKELEESFRTEVIRIMLRHPYLRQPNCPAAIRTTASNIVLTNNYKFSFLTLDTANDFQLPDTEYFEWYCKKLITKSEASNSLSSDNSSTTPQSSYNEDSKNDDSNNTNLEKNQGEESNNQNDNSQSNTTLTEESEKESHTPRSPKSSQSELWEEDDFQSNRIKEIIENITSWGSLSADIVEYIKASLKVQIDYRKALSGFRASVISSRRNLTRMRPNRRTDFQNLGSVYKMCTNLLVAVDVSGSISKEMMQKFYSIIGQFFKYGIESIDTVQFDTKLGEIVPMKKAQSRIKVTGRGGTDFQPVFDFFRTSKVRYDGLIIFTDGYAAEPQIIGRCPKVLWVFPDRNCEKNCAQKLKKYGRCCVIEC